MEDQVPIQSSAIQVGDSSIEPNVFSTASANPLENKKRGSLGTIFLIFVVFALIGGIGWLWYQNQKLTSTIEAQTRVINLLKESFNTDQAETEPEIATEPFFKSATDIDSSGWEKHTFTHSTISFELKLPSEISDIGELNKNITAGETGRQVCWNFPLQTGFRIVQPVFAGGGPCDWREFSMGIMSEDYEAGRMGGFSDLKGYVKNGVIFSLIGMMNTEFEIDQNLVSEFNHPENLEILFVRGKNAPDSSFPISGTPGEGYIGAIVNTGIDEYPAVTLRMELTESLTDNVFQEILSTFNFTNTNSSTPIPGVE